MSKRTKDLIPDITALEQKLKTVLMSDLPNFLSTTKSRREEVIGNRRFAGFAFLFAIAVMIALYFVQDNYGSIVSNILAGCAMIWLVVVLVTGRQWMANDKLLAKEISMALVPILTSTFDRMLMYTHDNEHREEAERLLAESELITSPDLTIISDDIYTVYGDNEVSFRELLVTQKVRNSKGNADSNVEIFKGMLVVAEMQNSHDAKTFISTDGDRSGFAHRTFWSDLLENSEAKETVLEWNDFENHLHVATTNGTTAREILTPGFMQDLYDWWLNHKLNIRISFMGNKMYLLLPEASIKINSSTTSTKLTSIERYAWALARPMWRSLMLIDDVVR